MTETTRTRRTGETNFVGEAGIRVLKPIDTPVTLGGIGVEGSLSLLLLGLTGGTSITLAGTFSWLDQDGKLFPDTGAAGTYTEIEQNRVSLEIAGIKRSKFQTSGGRIWFAMRSTSSSGISFDWIDHSLPGSEIGGRYYDGNTGRWYALSLYDRTGFGAEFLFDGWYIMPEIGIATSATHVCEDDAEIQEWPYSAQGLSLFFGISVGIGNPGNAVGVGTEPSAADYVRYFFQRAHMVGKDVILFEDFRKHQTRGLDLVGSLTGGGGLSGGNIWLLPSLLSLSTMMEADKRTDPLSFYLSSPTMGKIFTALFEAGVGLGYFIGGATGEDEHMPFISNGTASLNNLAIIGIHEAGVPEEFLFYAGIALGWVETLLSGAFDRDSRFGQGLANGGLMTSTAWSMNPERGSTSFVKSVSYMYAPASLLWGDVSSDIAGSYVQRTQIDDLVFTEFELRNTALMIASLGQFVVNQFAEPEDEVGYYNTKSSNSISTAIGIYHDFELGDYVTMGMGISFGVRALYGDDLAIEAAVEARPYIDVGFKVSESARLRLGVTAPAFVTFSGDRGIGVVPTIGVEF